MIRLLVLCGSLAVAACGSSKSHAPANTPEPTGPATKVDKPDEVPQAPTNSDTTIVGKAENAKAGAVVMDAKGRPIYVEGLAEWDDAHYGKQVSVTGKLVTKQIGPPTRNAAGEIQAGMDGESDVLENPRWELAP